MQEERGWTGGQVLGDAVLEAKQTIPCGKCGENEALVNVMSRPCLTERLPVSTTFHSHLVPATGSSPLKRRLKPTLERKGASSAVRQSGPYPSSLIQCWPGQLNQTLSLLHSSSQRKWNKIHNFQNCIIQSSKDLNKSFRSFTNGWFSF